MFFLHIQTLHRMQEQPQYAGFSGGVAGDSPSPSPAYPPSSHVSSHPEPGPGFPLYPPTSKSVLSYMGATGHMASSSLLPPQPPSPSSSWQSTPPTSTQVRNSKISRSHDCMFQYSNDGLPNRRRPSLSVTPTPPTRDSPGLVTAWAGPGTRVTTSPRWRPTCTPTTA